MKLIANNRFCAALNGKSPTFLRAISRNFFTPCAGGGSLLEAVTIAATNELPGDVILPACLNLNRFRSQLSPGKVYPGADGGACGHGRKAGIRIKSESQTFARGFYEEKPRREEPKTKTNLKKGANARLKK